MFEVTVTKGEQGALSAGRLLTKPSWSHGQWIQAQVYECVKQNHACGVLKSQQSPEHRTRKQ